MLFLNRRSVNLILGKSFIFLLVHLLCIPVTSAQSYDEELRRIKEETRKGFSENLREFNSYPDRPESDGPFNRDNVEDFLRDNIPHFISSDKDFTKVYNYRWWMMSKHFRLWKDPEDHKDYWVITEFFGWPAHGSISGAIPCPAGHQFYDLRWFRDPKYLRSYIDFYMKGYASRHDQREGPNFHTHIRRPESHHFSSWMIDGTEAFLKIHPDNPWRNGLLPYLEKHQKVWDDTFTVRKAGARTDGLYKVLDLYDGMEFTISATLPLIESDGPYAIYTEETWKQYYLGWGTIDNLRNSGHVKKFPEAFANAYPLVYLVRPSVNSYYYGNLHSLGDLYALKAQESGSETDLSKSEHYLQRARLQRDKTLSVLWNGADEFFYSFTAADNAYGVKDKMSRVRESAGYTPWYFNMIPKGDTTYDKAWDMFSSEKGFYGKKGMTTAEQQHPLFNEKAYAWNGRGWPFQNSVVYKAYANYLRNYKGEITASDKELLYDHVKKLVSLHGEESNIGEWYIPGSGSEFGGVKDYFHSTFPDILIADLLGFTPSHDNSFSLRPLLPGNAWDYFYLGNIRYHDHDIDIIWKKDWDTDRKGDQGAMRVWVDGKLTAEAASLSDTITVTLKDKPGF
ncbi:MGH1-like glycoside hydrolase domain-containing protein [Sinomicrobium soli]|uniref:MGH1-like glycoside hydrolase domain-containing protein n=1 Tax=Sinomicrobium sp. N-1-3-6 TaxID=2219864 RepID=UPI000DCDF210|nr:hypothetical protein [Sinomicrobium sp. N-1-3-6]RAV28570.1 hypothetical protein DN748_13225 [Sinomicrobium sp. N-1-3-6]